MSLPLLGCNMQASIRNRTFINGADQYVEALNKVSTGQKVHGNILVAKDGLVLLNKGYGQANYEESVGFTEDTKFLIGSITKPITAIAIMQLQEKGLLDINDPVSKYIPEQTRGNEITIENLLNHTSGLSRDVNVSLYHPIPKEELINKAKTQPFISDPGISTIYSNINYSLLAYIVENVSGQTYEEYLEDNIFKPLHMNSTKAAASNNDLPDMAEGYFVSDSQLNKVSGTIYDVSVFFGSGNIYSTTKDLYLLDRGLYEEKILSRESIVMMYENGYGWGVGELNGNKWVGHNGLLNNGYSSTLLRFPEEDLVVIALLNVSNQDNLSFNIAQVLSLMALGEEIVLPIEKEMISLSGDDLQRFEGEYELENGSKVSVQSTDNYLMLEPSIRKIKFFPYSESHFFAEGVEYRTIEFTSDDNGDINGLLFRECVVEFKGKKVK